MQAGTLSDGTFSGSAGTYTGGVSIESDTFIGDSTASATDFQGNASSATKLGSSDGTIQILAGSGVTQGVSSSAVIYTNGGDIELTTSLINTTVTSKTLQGLPTPAAATVVASDTILEGFGKLQSQINGIADGLQFQGTWNASMDTGGTDNTPGGTPNLVSGGGEASSGTTDATTANELVDSTKNFTTAPNIVAVGDKVINQADGQTALVTSIANAASGRLGIGADIMLTGEAYIIDKTPFITAGHYYVVNAVGATTARNATLNGVQDWQIGDWVIASTTNVWQKLNNSAVEGSGTENRLPKWTAAVSTLVDSDIIDNGNLIKLQSDIELGSASTDSVDSIGVLTADEQLILKKGLGLGGATYGTAGQVLTSAGAAADVPTWTTPTTGVVESITGGTGITVDDSSNPGTAAIPVVSIDYLGTDNAILSATAATEAILTTDQIWFNDIATLAPATVNQIKKAPISSLPFDQYTSWTIEADDGNTEAITAGAIVDFVGVGNVSTAWDATANELKISASENPGTGTALTLPVWEAGGATLGDSMVSQNNASGTILTIAASSPTLIIKNTANATQGQVEIQAENAGNARFISKGITDVAANATYGGYTFNQKREITGAGAAVSNRNVFTIFADNTTKFAGSFAVGGNTVVEAFNTDNIKISGSSISGTVSQNTLLIDNLTGNSRFYSQGINTTTKGTFNFNCGTSDALGSTTLAIASTGITVTGNADISGNITVPGAISAGANGGLRIHSNGTKFFNVTAANAARTNIMDIGAPDARFKDLYLGSDADIQGNVQIDGNLTVDGHIIHGGGGGGTGKGGTFTKLYTTGNAGTAGVAFTISRATTGVMIFDVMLTSDTSTACAVAKKFTVVKSYGASPLFNKILDTGPDFDTSDFTVVFAQDTTDLSIKCTITPVQTNTQKIGITLDLGFGQHDATVVMN